MIKASKCKVCGKPITLNIDDDYAELGDPYKLEKLGTCDKCVAQHALQQKMNTALERISAMLRIVGNDVEERPALLGKAEKILKAYLRLISTKEKLREELPWDDTILDKYAAHPEKLDGVIDFMRDTVRQVVRQQQLDLIGREREKD